MNSERLGSVVNVYVPHIIAYYNSRGDSYTRQSSNRTLPNGDPSPVSQAPTTGSAMADQPLPSATATAHHTEDDTGVLTQRAQSLPRRNMPPSVDQQNFAHQPSESFVPVHEDRQDSTANTAKNAAQECPGPSAVGSSYPAITECSVSDTSPQQNQGSEMGQTQRKITDFLKRKKVSFEGIEGDESKWESPGQTATSPDSTLAKSDVAIDNAGSATWNQDQDVSHSKPACDACSSKELQHAEAQSVLSTKLPPTTSHLSLLDPDDAASLAQKKTQTTSASRDASLSHLSFTIRQLMSSGNKDYAVTSGDSAIFTLHNTSATQKVVTGYKEASPSRSTYGRW